MWLSCFRRSRKADVGAFGAALTLASLMATCPRAVLAVDFGDPLGPAEPLQSSDAPHAGPAVGITPPGNRVELWLTGSASGLDLVATATPSPFGQAWPTPVLISSYDWMGYPSVAVDAEGGFMAVWERGALTPGTQGIFGRRYSSSGLPVGAEFPINTTMPQDIEHVRVATNEQGSRYLVAWKSKEASSYSVRAQLYDGSMQPIGAEQQVDADGSDPARPVDVAVERTSEDGVVVWTGYPTSPKIEANTVYFRRVGSNGVLGPPRQVEGPLVPDGFVRVAQNSPAAAWSSGGPIAIAWKEELREVSTGAYYSRIVLARFVVHLNIWVGLASSNLVSGRDGVSNPTIGVDSVDTAWLAWEHRETASGPSAVHARISYLMNDFGHSDFVIEPAGDAKNFAPRVAVDADSDATFVWTRLNGDGSVQAMRRRYRGEGWAQVEVAMQAPSSPVIPGALADLTITVDNHGYPSAPGYDSATGLSVELGAPGGAELSGPAEGIWQCAGQEPMRCTYDDAVGAQDSALPLQVRLRAPSSHGTVVVTATADSEQTPAPHSASATIQVADVSPDVPVFPVVGDVAPGSEQISAPVMISGIDVPVPISVQQGQYSLNGGAFTHVAGQVAPGDSVRVRHTAAATFSTDVVTTLTVGGVDATFRSTTLAADTTPDPFAFAAVSGVARNAVQTSNEILVAGINTSTPLSVAGGTFSIDGGAFSDLARSVEAGQRVRVQHASAGGFSASTTTVLTIGGVSASFVSTTEAMDTLPAAFAFVDQTGVATGVAIASAPITVAGINAPATVSVAGGSYSVNGGAFTAAAGTVQAGDQVRVQHLTSASALSAVNTTLTVGGVSDVFTSTTGSSDTTPNAFAFADVTGARRNRSVDSNTIVLSGFNATVPLSIAGGGASYQKNGGSWTSAPGTVRSGDTLRLRMTASSSSNTTVSATVTVGGVSDTWSVTSGTK